MMECQTQTKNSVGRPRVSITPEQVRELREGGASWRRIAKVLRIGATTARRLFRSNS